MKLEGKVAAITGGNSGIGLATARLFIQHGAKVAILGRSEDTLHQVSDELGTDVLTVQGDVRSLPDLDRFFKATNHRFGTIDALVANSGIAKFSSIAEFSEDLFDELCGVNFRGAFFTVQRALPYLRDGASVILVGSAGDKQGRPFTSIYNATKAAVCSLARSLSAELLPRRIRVNVLSPGMIDTPIITRSGGLPGATPEEIAEAITQTLPLKRRGTAEEIASGMLFLASDDSQYCLGSELLIDGGMSRIAQ